jgi:hypothetical protein
MESELGTIMELAETIAEQTGRSEDLKKKFNMGMTTLRRRIGLLRHFGVQIKSVRTSGAKTGTWSYRIENWQQVKKVILIWKELEAKQEKILEEL